MNSPDNPAYRDMAVSWLDGVPVVSEVRMMGDGQPSIVVYSKDESLQIMWARIESLQAARRLRDQAWGEESQRQYRESGGPFGA